MFSDKNAYSNNWKIRYESLLNRYETAFTAIETYRVSFRFHSRNQFHRTTFPSLSNPQRLQYHLLLKWLNTLLRVCPQTTLQTFVYQTSAFDTCCNAIVSILVNTTLQNQLAVKKYKQDLPNARKKWREYLTVGMEGKDDV